MKANDHALKQLLVGLPRRRHDQLAVAALQRDDGRQRQLAQPSGQELEDLLRVEGMRKILRRVDCERVDARLHVLQGGIDRRD